MLLRGRGPLCLQPWGDSECSPGAGSVGPPAFLAPELSPPAYTQAGTRAWVPFRGTRVQRDRSAPDGVGGGETGTAAGTLVLLALGVHGALSRQP